MLDDLCPLLQRSSRTSWTPRWRARHRAGGPWRAARREPGRSTRYLRELNPQMPGHRRRQALATVLDVYADALPDLLRPLRDTVRPATRWSRRRQKLAPFLDRHDRRADTTRLPRRRTATRSSGSASVSGRCWSCWPPTRPSTRACSRASSALAAAGRGGVRRTASATSRWRSRPTAGGTTAGDEPVYGARQRPDCAACRTRRSRSPELPDQRRRRRRRRARRQERRAPGAPEAGRRGSAPGGLAGTAGEQSAGQPARRRRRWASPPAEVPDIAVAPVRPAARGDGGERAVSVLNKHDRRAAGQADRSSRSSPSWSPACWRHARQPDLPAARDTRRVSPTSPACSRATTCASPASGSGR